MNDLRIYVDLPAPPDVLDLLRDGTQGHQLLFPRTPASSILGAPVHDPQFTAADIAFGQPDPQAVAEARRLKWIHVSSSGITRYDNPLFRSLMAERKIALSNSASVYNEACAVHVLSFMLAQARNLPRAFDSRAANGSAAWHALRGASSTLRGETVLIIGFGAIGRRFAELLGPFDMKLIAYRRKARGNELIPVIAEDQLVPALQAADHVVNILPDSAETRHFFDTGRLAAIKPGAIFYNIGRGTTVNQDALLDALRSGHLKAAWLDVTDPEPLPDNHPLRAQPNCFITPHIAGGQTAEAKALVCHFLQNLQHFVRGEPLLDRVM
ncbi:MAG: D-2-hydroxyacid dehydrogenase [Verrucomicrobiota bacterium]|jgi:phosphoglycerate dehydrogenase-like enzyme